MTFQAFTEMQINKIESSKKLRYLDFQIENLRKSKARYEITESEISTLIPETKVYSAVGRMFVLSSLPEIQDELKQKKEHVIEMIEQCDKNKDFVVKNLKTQEESLRELVMQKKESK